MSIFSSIFGGNEEKEQQPEEKSASANTSSSGIGSFFWSALKILAIIALAVVALVSFNDAARDKLDDLTKDKDGKNGWGTGIRNALIGAKDKVIEAGAAVSKALGNTPEEKKGLDIGVKEVAGAAVGAGLIKAAHTRYFSPNTLVNGEGVNLTKQENKALERMKVLKAEQEALKGQPAQAVEEAKIARAAAIKAARAEKDAKAIVKSKKIWKNPVEKFKAGREFEAAHTATQEADKALKEAQEKIEKLKKDIKANAAEIAKAEKIIPKVIMTRAEAETAGIIKYDTEYGDLTNNNKAKAAKTPKGGVKAATAKKVFVSNEIGFIEATTEPVSVKIPKGGEEIPTKVVKIDGLGEMHVRDDSKLVNGTKASAGGKVFVSKEIGFIEPTPEGQRENITIEEVKTPTAKGGMWSSTKALLPAVMEATAKISSWAGSYIAASEGGQHSIKLWEHKDKNGENDKQALAVVEAVTSGLEGGGFANMAVGKPLAFLIATPLKDAVYVADTIVSGGKPSLRKSTSASAVEPVVGPVIDYTLDQIYGEKYDHAKVTEQRAREALEIEKNLTPAQKKTLSELRQQAKASELIIDQLMLIDHAKQLTPASASDKTKNNDRGQQ